MGNRKEWTFVIGLILNFELREGSSTFCYSSPVRENKTHLLPLPLFSPERGSWARLWEWPHCAIDDTEDHHPPLPQAAITFPTSYFFSYLSPGAGGTNEMKKNFFLHWTRTLRTLSLLLVSSVLCTGTKICSVAETKGYPLWRDWWLLPDLKSFISEQVDCKRRWLQNSPALGWVMILPL